jgi:hypothetical protein
VNVIYWATQSVDEPEVPPPGLTAAYIALLASNPPQYVVLAEVQVAEQLNVWTAAGGGFTNTFYTSWFRQDLTSIISGGIYRRLDFVRQNNVTYTSQSSIASVDANAGSYFHDTTTNRIYVRTVSGSNPNSFAFFGAWFTLFFSTSKIDFTDQPLYWPIISGQLPALRSEMPDLLFGSTINASGQLSLHNGDGLFDRISAQYIWRNKQVTLKLGGVGLLYEDFATIVTMRINQTAINDIEFILNLEHSGTILNRSIPPRTWGDGLVYPYAREEILGENQPWLIGIVKDARVPLTSITAGSGYGFYQYQDLSPSLALGFVSAVYAISRTDGSRTQLTVGDYTATGTSITILNATYHYDDYDIWADILQLGFGTPGEIAKQLLLWLGEGSDRIDHTGFDLWSDDNPAPAGTYLNVAVPASDVMRTIEQSGLGQVYINTAGLWTARFFDPSEAHWTLRDEDFVSWEPEVDLTAVLNEVRVRYDYHHATDSNSETSSSSDTVLYGSETSDSHSIPTYLRNQWDASVLANTMRFFFSSPGHKIRFEERGLTLMTAAVGDFVAVHRNRGPVARTGKYEGQLLQIVSLEKVLNVDTPVVRGVLWDLGGNADRIARCIFPDDDLNWADATTEEKAFYGFCSDADGYIDPTDPLTRELKVAF